MRRILFDSQRPRLPLGASAPLPVAATVVEREKLVAVRVKGDLDLIEIYASPVAAAPTPARVGPPSMRKPLSRPKSKTSSGLPRHPFGIIREAERHEKVCGCSHSHRRRRNAPWRTPGCNLSPALDLDVELLEPNRVSSLLTPVRTVR